MISVRRMLQMLALGCLPCFMAGASPVDEPFFSCTDYHCNTRRLVSLSAGQWEEVRAQFAADGSPARERQAIRRAIALMERDVGAATGTWRDLGENVRGAGQPGQLDCISESKNTTTYLRLLSDDGLLKWHVVEPRAMRNPWLLDVHWTAVIRERTGGARFAVDSWFLDNGEPPYVQPLEDWLDGVSPDEQH